MATYLVTVKGFDYFYSPPEETVTLKIKLKKDKTPVDWFMSKPEVYSRFNFVPDVLINFWKISKV